MTPAAVGTTPDGEPGPLTARAVMVWQAAHGLDADGMVGPNTLAAIHQARTPSKPSTRAHVSTLCLWWDLGPGWSVGDAEGFADELESMGVDVIGLMADRSEPMGSGKPWWRWRPGAAATFARVLRTRGIDVDLVLWPRPNTTYLKGYADELPALVDAVQPRCVQLDVEGNWTHRHKRGFRTMHDAADALFDIVRGTGVGMVGATTYPFHAEHNPAQASVTPYVDLIIPQAYASYRKQETSEHWGAHLGPGAHQRVTWERVRRVQSTQTRWAWGLAAYLQHYPDKGVEVSMAKQLDAALDLYASAHPGQGCEVWLWSAKWLMNGSKHHDALARRFVERIKQRYGEDACR